MADEPASNIPPTSAPNPVRRQVDDRVRKLALDLVGSIDLEDDDWRVAPLPRFSGPDRPVDNEAAESAEADPTDRHP